MNRSPRWLMDLHVTDDPAADAARWLAQRVRDAVQHRGEATVAVSGGSTAPPMFTALLSLDVPWERTTIWQVDERVAPDGHPDRNAQQLVAVPAQVRLMPVTDPDLDTAAARYGAGLPVRFDIVHLGLGDDGHTASWPPGHRVVDSDRPCEAIGQFNGRRRMTLTPRVVNAARHRLLVATGAAKAEILERWVRGDPELPADRLLRDGLTAFVDHAAASRLST